MELRLKKSLWVIRKILELFVFLDFFKHFRNVEKSLNIFNKKKMTLIDNIFLNLHTGKNVLDKCVNV